MNDITKVILFILYSITLLTIGRFVLQPKLVVQTSSQIEERYVDTMDSLVYDSGKLKREIATLRDSLKKKVVYIASVSEIDSIVGEDSTQSTAVYRQWLQNLGKEGIRLSNKSLGISEIVFGSKYFVELYYLRQDYSTVSQITVKQDNLILNLESQITIKDSTINDYKLELGKALAIQKESWLKSIYNFLNSFPVGYVLGIISGYFIYETLTK